MIRHRAIPSTFVVAFAVGCLASSAKAASTPCPPSPNIILIVADDLGWADLPFFSPAIHWQDQDHPASTPDYALMRPDLNRFAARVFATQSTSAGSDKSDLQTSVRSDGVQHFAGNPTPTPLPSYEVRPLDYTNPPGGTGFYQRSDSTSPCGDPNVEASPDCTPARDVLEHAGGLGRIAREGLVFSSFYATSAVCSPTRASILTGRFLRDHRVFQVGDYLPTQEITIAEYLKQRCPGYQPFGSTLPLPTDCYHTGLIGKWHLGSYVNSIPPSQGFDEGVWYSAQRHGYFSGPFRCRTGPGVKQCATSREEACCYQPASRPTGIWNLHGKKGLSQKLVCNDDTGRADTAGGGAGCSYTTRVYRDLAKDFIANAPRPYFLSLMLQTPHAYIDAPLRTISHYQTNNQPSTFTGPVLWAAIEEMDAAIGAILDAVDPATTLVLFTSDQGRGETGGIPNLAGGKYQVAEGGIRVGMLAWGCDVDHQAKTSRVLASQVDLFKTIAEAAGGSGAENLTLVDDGRSEIATPGLGCPAPTPPCEEREIRGKSLLPILKGQGGSGSDHVFATFLAGRAVVSNVGLPPPTPVPGAPALKPGVCGDFRYDDATHLVMRAGSCATCSTDTDCTSPGGSSTPVTCAVTGQVCVPHDLHGTCSGSNPLDCANDRDCRGCEDVSRTCSGDPARSCGAPEDCIGAASCRYDDFTPSTVLHRCDACELKEGSPCVQCGSNETCRQISIPCSHCWPAAWKLHDSYGNPAGLYDLNSNPEQEERLNCVSIPALAPIRTALDKEIDCHLGEKASACSP